MHLYGPRCGWHPPLLLECILKRQHSILRIWEVGFLFVCCFCLFCFVNNFSLFDPWDNNTHFSWHSEPEFHCTPWPIMLQSLQISESSLPSENPILCPFSSFPFQSFPLSLSLLITFPLILLGRKCLPVLQGNRCQLQLQG